MRVRISIFIVIVALVTWSAVSVLLLALTVGTGPCRLVVPVPPGGFPNGVVPTMTQAEMDAQTAACNAPRVGDFLIPAVGYTLIVGLGVASATGRKRGVRVDP